MEALLQSLAMKYGMDKAVQLLGIDKQTQTPKYAISLGGRSINPMNILKRAGLNQGMKGIMSGGKMSSMLGPGLLLGLGYLTNPLRKGSYNYNPELQGQIDYASGRGYIGKNPGTGLGQYTNKSVLSGQNVVSMFGTNNYAKQLQKHIDKYGDKDGKGQAELEDLTTDEFDKVDAFMETQNTNNNYGGATQSGGFDPGGFEQDGTGRQGYAEGENVEESGVKQFTPPPEKTGILQKLFGIDTDKLYDQGFDSMNKYRERNPDNPREVLQTAGGKLSNLRHGVSTSLLRDAILKKINPGSYKMKEAPPSMNFEELKMSEKGPNKAAKGVASLLAYLGAGSNEIGTDFFSQETMEDLTANLLGLMKTDVYDTPEDKAAMLNEILENDTGGINTYLQSLAPKEKYQEDAMLFPPMRQDKMRDQDLLFMKAEEDYEDKVKNLGLGDMDG